MEKAEEAFKDATKAYDKTVTARSQEIWEKFALL